MEAALANNRGSFFSTLGVVDAERIEMLEAALEALPDADSSSRARLLSRLCNELAFGPLERRLSLARAPMAMARRVGDAVTQVEVTSDCSASLRIPSTLDECRVDLFEALALAERLDDPVRKYWVAANMAIEAVRFGDFELGAASLAAQSELAAKLQQPMLVWLTTYMRATDASLHGDTTVAEELATSALEIGTASGQPDVFTFYGTQLMEIRLQQGRLGELVSLVADIVEQNPGVPSYSGALAAAALDADDEPLARRLVEEAVTDGFALPMDTAWLDGMLMYARPSDRAGNRICCRTAPRTSRPVPLAGAPRGRDVSRACCDVPRRTRRRAWPMRRVRGVLRGGPRAQSSRWHAICRGAYRHPVGSDVATPR